MSTDISKVCDKIILISFYLAFILVPLILAPWNYELFEYNKMMVVYGLTIIILSAWLIKMVVGKTIIFQRTPFDIPILIFLISQFLSFLFSMDRHVSFWGYYSRFHGGLLSTISYVVLFYALVSNLSNLSYLKNLLKIVLGTGFFVSFYGILEHFGIDKNLWVQDVQNRVFSTLGQPNWLAAYLAVLIPISIGIGLSNTFGRKKVPSSCHPERPRTAGESRDLSQIKSVERDSSPRFAGLGMTGGVFTLKVLFFIGLSFLFYLTLLYTKSRSGLLGFWVADIVFWGVILLRAKQEEKVERLLRAKREVLGLWPRTLITHFLITNFLFLTFSFFIGGSGLGPLEKYSWPVLSQRWQKQPAVTQTPTRPLGESLITTGVTESGEIRKIVWTGAFDIFKNNPILGTGVETFAFAYYRYRPVAHNLTSEWDFLYNKAHNEYLNFLATTGIVGFGSYLLFILSFIGWNIKTLLFCHSEPRFNRGEESFSTAFNQQTASGVKDPSTKKTLILLSALFAGWTSILVTNFFGFSVVILGLFFFLIPGVSFIVQEQQLNNLTIKQFRLSFSRKVQISLISLISLIGLFLEFSLIQFWRADTFFSQGYKLNRSGQTTLAYEKLNKAIELNPLEPFYHDEYSFALSTLAQAAFLQKEATLSAILTEKAQSESNLAIKTSPNNVNFYKTRTRVFYALAQTDPKFYLEALEAIYKASLLSPTDPKISYNLAILEARVGEIDKALEELSKTIKLKPDYRDAYFARALILKDQGKNEQARKELQFILNKIEPQDPEVKRKLEEWK